MVTTVRFKADRIIYKYIYGIEDTKTPSGLRNEIETFIRNGIKNCTIAKGRK